VARSIQRQIHDNLGIHRPLVNAADDTGEVVADAGPGVGIPQQEYCRRLDQRDDLSTRRQGQVLDGITRDLGFQFTAVVERKEYLSAYRTHLDPRDGARKLVPRARPQRDPAQEALESRFIFDVRAGGFAMQMVHRGLILVLDGPEHRDEFATVVGQLRSASAHAANVAVDPLESRPGC